MPIVRIGWAADLRSRLRATIRMLAPSTWTTDLVRTFRQLR